MRRRKAKELTQSPTARRDQYLNWNLEGLAPESALTRSVTFQTDKVARSLPAAACRE